jgi:hypothetical protein
MLCAIDQGAEFNIHPPYKIPLSERLVEIARSVAYGEGNLAAGPMYESMQINGDQITISFTNVGSGILSKDVQLDTHFVSGATLEGFEICGGDHVYHDADAVVSGSEVIVSSPQVTDPVAVRYAWIGFPLCNLYNVEGFPCVPFRTETNFPPFFLTEPITESGAIADIPYSSTLADNAMDLDAGDTISISKVDGAEWLTVGVDGALTGTPGLTDVGENIFTVRIDSSDGHFSQTQLIIEVLPSPSDTGYFTFLASDDASITNGTTDNKGSLNRMSLRSSAAYSGYIKFEVLGGGNITSATLRLKTRTVGGTDTTVYAIADNSWEEMTINGTNEPAMGAALDTLTDIEAYTWYGFDVSAAVTGDGTYSFGIMTTQSPWLDWQTKEGVDSHPELDLTYGPPIGDPDISGNGSVNIADLAIMASHWQDICGEIDWCEGADLDFNSTVDANDLRALAESWLDGVTVP